MNLKIILIINLALTYIIAAPGITNAQDKKPNILFIVSDDTGYGDLGPYGGGEGRGMPLIGWQPLA
jgi:hypothetical protein